MRRWTLRLGWMALVLGLSLALGACGPESGDDGTGSEAGTVAFSDLVADPDQYAGQRLCTEGVYARGFEVNDLGAATYEKDGYTHLTQPVIWLEQANIQSLEDCTGTDTQPPFEFCQAAVCGVFETGGGYGHVGGYEFQIRGEGLRPAPSPTPPVASQPPEEDLPLVVEDGFEFGLDGWETGADVPEDPNRPGHPVAWDVEANGEQPHQGSRSVQFTLDGSQGEGTIWLMQHFEVPAGVELIVNLRFDLWSLSKSDTTLAMVAAYAGPVPPQAKEDFNLAHAADLASQWREYVYTFPVSSDEGQIWVAVGISAVWETEVTYYVDDVRVAIDAIGPDVRPPAAVLEVAGQEQASGLGSYCWSEPTGSDSTVAVCADMIGIITPDQPLAVPPALAGRIRLAPAGTPVELALRVLAVAPEEEIAMDLEGWRAWAGQAGQLHSLALEREPEFVLSLAPGLYVLELFARWEEWGDASYGFLVEVAAEDPLTAAAEPPALLIDETPIVADALDRPGRFEYMDILGEGILARIEGLRARDAELRLVVANEVLAPFGYQLESHFDAEWNRTFYDLVREGVAQPVLSGLSHFWPVSANASGTDFVMAAENAPNTFPMYLLVHKESVQEWDAMTSNLLAPAYVGDALATITTTPEMTFTYQVLLDGQAAYTGTAAMVGAYHPLRSFTAWDGNWALEVDDHLIVDGQDLGEARGYDAVFGFARIQNQAFYFYQQAGQVRISYGGRTLPNAYDRVFHNQCCEAAIQNVERLADSVLFHALWDGTWYFVEAGVFDGEMPGTARYTAPEGWSFRYPAHWDRLDPELGLVQETATGKTVTFDSAPATQAELGAWLESEIARKLEATEAENTLAEPLSESQERDLTVYRYAILSKMEGAETLLRTTVFFDGQRRTAFYAEIPPVTEEEYEAIVGTFKGAIW